MKKIYFISLAILATVGMLCSCEKGGKGHGGKNNGNGNGGDASVEITIDGDFSDWTSTAIATAEYPEDDATYPNLHVMKVAADEDNLFFYFEYELAEGQHKSAIDIMIDCDHNPLTGFISWIWDKGGCGYEYLLESEGGFLNENATGVKNMDDMAIYFAKNYLNPTSNEQVDAWGAGAVQERLTNKDFAENKGYVKDGIVYMELSIPRSVVNATRAGYVGVGVTFSDVADELSWNEEHTESWYDWITTGILPLDEGIGKSFLLDVQVP
ncbi:MAG: hypothetical protein J6X25_09835 [Bacteroidales bacterium]|nr:hypothetical protein [Bacteroidales bacterium]